MIRICIFAGTTEGRKLIEFLEDKKKAHVTACVAGEYGKIVLGNTKAKIYSKRMGAVEIQEFFLENKFDFIIDATHPYATGVTENIKQANASFKTQYIRIIRESIGKTYFETIENAVSYMNTKTGNILLTTGSKDLHSYCNIDNYKNRVYVRVLPMQSSLEICEKQEYQPSHIIAMQGPFSHDLNVAMLKAYDIKMLVTKDSGVNGGFEEKFSACNELGVECIIIDRPADEEGISFLKALEFLKEKLNITTKQRVHIIGIGTGHIAQMSVQAVETLKRVNVIIGAKRITDSCLSFHKPIINSFLAKDVIEVAENNTEYTDIAVVMSGDIGFYSGAKKMYEELSNFEVSTVCGISSLVYFSSKLKIPWENIMVISLHGKAAHVIHAVKTNEIVFCLVGGSDGVRSLCNLLCDYGFYHTTLFVGENLSYKNEKISKGTAEELKTKEFSPLSTVIIENKAYSEKQMIGIDDNEFIRVEKIPMTKSEVRAISLSKLKLERDSVIYDIGAGTGSVSIECALASPEGKVYSIEKNQHAIDVIKRNKIKFSAQNIEVISGYAPKALEELEKPTHAFIGGSSGNAKEIIEVLLKKNPNIRIVINIVALETLAQTLSIIKQLKLKDTEIIQVNISKSKKLGDYSMMMGQNPIFIVTC